MFTFYVYISYTHIIFLLFFKSMFSNHHLHSHESLCKHMCVSNVCKDINEYSFLNRDTDNFNFPLNKGEWQIKGRYY